MEIEITGSYPIILDGETAGEITVSREGLFWRFDAECEMRSEIVRLSVYGDEKEGYLGVMEPSGDMLKLTKKLSRNALGVFPQVITHGGQKGEYDNGEAETSEDMTDSSDSSQYSGEFPRSYYNKGIDSGSDPPEDNKPPPKSSSYPPLLSEELLWQPCACPCSLFTGLEEKRFCSYIKGAFVAQNDEDLLLAVPESLALELPDSNALNFLYKIIILGDIYLVCIIKQGKSISER